MTGQLNREEMLALNPGIDEAELEKCAQALVDLRRARGKRDGYRLASPITRRRAMTGDDPGKDPRTVYLRPK